MARRKTWTERRPLSSCEVGVLHAFGPGYLHAPNHILEFRGSNDRQMRIPLRGLTLVCLYGPVRVTAGAIRLVTEVGASLAYLSANGQRFNGVLHSPNGNSTTRRYRQYQASRDESWRLAQAKQIVKEKLTTVEESLSHFAKHGKSSDSVRALQHDLAELQLKVQNANSLNILRGLEGVTARRWFEVLGQQLPDGWTLPGRVKRPPTDPVNALLSLGYTLLFQRHEAACQALGLDPAIGTLHEYRQGRASLACDLVEPFRIPCVDRLLLACLNRRQFQPNDFTQRDDGSIQMTQEACQRWVGACETWWHDSASGALTYQMQFIGRVIRLAENLPELSWPKEPETDTIALDSNECASVAVPG